MGDYRQLKMRTSLARVLPEMGELPSRCELHTSDNQSAVAWNWIMQPAFPEQKVKMDFNTMILGDPACAAERVFFFRCFGQDIAATAARVTEDGIGHLHWVGTHPTWTGMGAARYTSIAAMQCMKDMGITECQLSTDDFRLPAIKIYFDLGFEPLYEAGDEEMEARWAAVREKLASYVKPEKKDILLWPDGEAPDTAACGDQPQPTLTPFVAEGSRGAVVVCPGGGYSMRAYHEGAPIARSIQLGGVSAFVLNYRVQPFTSVDTPIGDALRAIRVVRSMGYEKVAILGFSAGGHMTAMAATKYDLGNPDAEDPIERFSSRPDAFVPCYGATSFYHFRKSPWMPQLWGKRASDWKMLGQYSAECLVTPDTPPAFIWHTADDNVVSVEMVFDLARALASKGVPCEMHIFKHGRHGLGQASGYADIQQWPDMLNTWLGGLGFGGK